MHIEKAKNDYSIPVEENQLLTKLSHITGHPTIQLKKTFQINNKNNNDIILLKRYYYQLNKNLPDFFNEEFFQ